MAFDRHTVTYNDVELPNPVGSYRMTYDMVGKTFTFEQDFVVDGADEEGENDPSTYVTAHGELIDALETVDKALVVTWVNDAGEIHRFDPSDGSTRRTRAQIVRGGGEFDLAASAKLTLRVTGDLPADDWHGGAASRGWTEYQVLENNSTRSQPVYTFDMEYRFSSAADALAAVRDATNGAEAIAEAWLTANAIRGNASNYVLMDDSPYSVDDQHSVLRARLTYRYQLVPATTGGLSKTAGHIVDQVSIAPTRSNQWGGPPGDTDDPPYPMTVTATFRIESTATDYTALNDYYDTVLAPLVEYYVAQYLSTGGAVVTGGGRGVYIVLDESYVERLDASTAQISWVVQAVDSWITWKSRKAWPTDHGLVARKFADGQEHTYDLQHPYEREQYTETIRGQYVTEGANELTREALMSLLPPIPNGYVLEASEPEMESTIGRQFGGGLVRVHDVSLKRRALRAETSSRQRAEITGAADLPTLAGL